MSIDLWTTFHVKCSAVWTIWRPCSGEPSVPDRMPSVHATATFHVKPAGGEIPSKVTNLSIRINLFFSHSQDTLTFRSLAATVCTTSLNIQKFYLLPTEYLYPLYVSQEKHWRFPYTSVSQPLWDRGPVNSFIQDEGSVPTNLLVNTFPIFLSS